MTMQYQLPKTPFKNEAKFTAWFGKQIKDQWWFWHKISDASYEQKPFDWIATIDWITHCIEIKIWSEKSKTDIFKKLRPNQKFWLRRVKENGWSALVVYYNKLHNKYWVLEFNDELVITI